MTPRLVNFNLKIYKKKKHEKIVYPRLFKNNKKSGIKIPLTTYTPKKNN